MSTLGTQSPQTSNIVVPWICWIKTCLLSVKFMSPRTTLQSWPRPSKWSDEFNLPAGDIIEISTPVEFVSLLFFWGETEGVSSRGNQPSKYLPWEAISILLKIGMDSSVWPVSLFPTTWHSRLCPCGNSRDNLQISSLERKQQTRGLNVTNMLEIWAGSRPVILRVLKIIR